MIVFTWKWPVPGSGSVGMIEKAGGRRVGSRRLTENVEAVIKQAVWTAIKFFRLTFFKSEPRNPDLSQPQRQIDWVKFFFRIKKLKSSLRDPLGHSGSFSSVKHHPFHPIWAISVKKYTTKVNDEAKKWFIFNWSVKYTLSPLSLPILR